MSDVITVKGAKAGQDKARKPSIAKDSIASTSTAKLLYGLAEGEVYGLVDGGKSIRLDGTPLLDDNGSSNFEGVTWDFRHGTNEQEYIQGFPDVSNETGIGVELKSSQPFIKAFTDTQLSAIRVRFKWNRLSKTDDEDGDVTGYKIDYAIDLQTDGGAYQNVLTTKIEDKTSAGYERTHRIDLPKATSGWQIRVRRITPNSDSEYIQDEMYIDAVAEVIDVKLAYPNTALLGIQYNAETFSSIAKIAVHMRGSIIRVPSNYDAVARTYTGIWDGTFKDAYSNNPAWVYYDLCMQWRYGLGDRLDATMIDKWSLYTLGQYCDEQVSDGQGGTEPRYTCNVYLQKQADAYQVLQNIAGLFAALSYWNGEKIFVDADVPKDPVYTFSRANVIGGQFEYTGTRARDRHTIVKVAWDNPANNFETEYEYVRDDKAIAKFGVKVLDLAAFGCTSQGQAQRMGLRALKTEQLETRQVSFSVGLDGVNCGIGNIINVSDELFAGRANGGRVSTVNSTQRIIELDREVVASAGDVLIINGGTGKSERRNISNVVGNRITVTASFTSAEPEHVWAIETADLKLMRFRVMQITENSDDNTYNIIGIQHEPQKYDAIDFGTDVKPTNITIVNPQTVDAPSAVTITSRHRVVQSQTIATLIIGWSQVKDAVSYDVEWRKDDGSWIKIPRTGNVSVEIDGVYSGQYMARVRAISPFDVQSQPTTSLLTAIEGKVGLPPVILGLVATGVLFGIELKWGFGAGSGDSDYTEIQTGSAPNTNVALLGQFSYPTNSHVITGLQGNLSQSYRARLVDKLGNKSAWSSWATATTDASADKVLDLVQGKINESSLNTALTTKIDKIGTLETGLDTETQNRIDAIIGAKKDATTKANEAKSLANTAQTAANNAATLAGNKGEVIYQSQTPAAARQLTQNLWIDTTGGKNTPKRWNGSAWVVVTDKAATDAQAAANTAIANAKTADDKAVAAQSTANTAKTDAKTADDKAVAAQQSATAALSSLSDISADNKLTAVEKQQVKLIFDDIQRTHADVLNRAAKYSVSTSEYASAYNDLSSYITPKLSDMSATSVIVRASFNTKFDTLFLKRADLDTAIVNAAKLIATNAQTTANDALSKATNANQSIVLILDEQETIKDDLGVQYETLQGVIVDYQPEYFDKTKYFSSQAENWTYAKTVARDNYAESQRITNLQSEFADNDATVRRELETLATKDAAFASDFTQLKAETEDNSALIQDLNLAITTPNTGLAAKVTILQTRTGDIEDKADDAQQAAQDAATLAGNKGEVIYQWQTPSVARQLPQNLWIDTTGGKNTPKRWDGSAWVVVTDKAAIDAQTAANTAIANAKTADDKAIAAQSTANTAKTNAKTADDKAIAAQQSATAALSSLSDISADNKLTAVEKQQVKLIFDDIQRTHTDVLNRAAKYSVSTSEYTSAYNDLSSYITPKLSDMSATSVIVRASFNTKFDTLFLKRADLDTAIVNAAKQTSDDAQNAANSALDKLQPANLATLVEGSGAFTDKFNTISGQYTTIQSTVNGQTTSIEVASAVGDLNKLKNEIAKARIDKDVIKLQAQSDALTSAIDNYTSKINEITALRNASSDTALRAEYAKQIAALNTAKDDANTQKSAITAQVNQLNAEKAELESLVLTESEVKAQHYIKLDSGGRVSGYGLLQDDTGNVDFAVNANSFRISPPTGTGRGETTFVHYTTAQTINGVTIPVGTYLANAYIASLSGGKIHANSITADRLVAKTITAESGVIGDLAVDTLQIADNAVTVPVAAFIESALSIATDNTYVEVLRLTVPASMGKTTVNFDASYVFQGRVTNRLLYLSAVFNGVSLFNDLIMCDDSNLRFGGSGILTASRVLPLGLDGDIVFYVKSSGTAGINVEIANRYAHSLTVRR